MQQRHRHIHSRRQRQPRRRRWRQQRDIFACFWGCGVDRTGCIQSAAIIKNVCGFNESSIPTMFDCILFCVGSKFIRLLVQTRWRRRRRGAGGSDREKRNTLKYFWYEYSFPLPLLVCLLGLMLSTACAFQFVCAHSLCHFSPCHEWTHRIIAAWRAYACLCECLCVSVHLLVYFVNNFVNWNTCECVVTYNEAVTCIANTAKKEISRTAQSQNERIRWAFFPSREHSHTHSGCL